MSGERVITMEQFNKDFTLNWCRRVCTVVNRATGKTYCYQVGQLKSIEVFAKEEDGFLQMLREHYGSEVGGLRNNGVIFTVALFAAAAFFGL